MWRLFGIRAHAAAVFLAAATCVASAQTMDESGATTGEFWSTRYQRFHQHDNPFPLAGGLDRPAGNLWAPPDVVVCEPQTMAAPLEPEQANAEAAVIAPGSAGLAAPFARTWGLGTQ